MSTFVGYVNRRLEALDLDNFVMDLRRTYKRSFLYPKGLITVIEKARFKVLIKISFDFTGHDFL